MRLFIELTDDQILQLQPMFDAVRDGNDTGNKCCIAAQIFEDGITIKLMSQNEAVALSLALGGNMSETPSGHSAYRAGIIRDNAKKLN